VSAHDAVVVGAGLAGLRAAALLSRRGVDVVLLEAGDRPGGRVATDVVEGFRCDRGFQVLNTSYRRCGPRSTSTPWTCARSSAGRRSAAPTAGCTNCSTRCAWVRRRRPRRCGPTRPTGCCR
jgi:monoamine oxidase